MTFLLVLHLFATNGDMKTHNMAIFADRTDCRIAGTLIARHFTQTTPNVVVKFSCDPTS